LKIEKDLNRRIGKNIKWALKGSALSQSKAAEMLGISRQTLSNYMSGSTPIDIDKLLKIAEITGKTASRFYMNLDYGHVLSNDPDQLISGLRDLTSIIKAKEALFESYVFRSDIPIPSALKNKFEQKIRQYAEIERINEISSYQFKIDSALNKFDKPQIELIAQKIRGLFEIGPATPISNPVYELERNNVKIIQFPEDNQDISGFSAHNDELGYCIYLNSKCTIERRFFTAAHELAHLIFHKKDYMRQDKAGVKPDSDTGSGHKAENLTGSDTASFSHADSGLSIIYKDKIKEDIADEFAGLFLVPSNSLASFCKNNFIENFIFENVIILKKYFNVSAKCMIKRLLKEGCISKLQYAELNEETDKRIDPYHEYEPIEKSRIVENHRFRNLVHRALANKKITESEAAAYLKNP
jgi:Zn-dependent peptidase ImmA (M78 family)/transcriptional regulator with XRE-family HTH domain